MLGSAVFVNYQRFRVWRQNLQGLQKFNQIVLQVRWQCVESQPLGQSLSVVRLDSFRGGCERRMMHERPALVVEAPQLASDELAVPRKECGRSDRKSRRLNSSHVA